VTAYLDTSVLLPTFMEEPASTAVDAYVIAAKDEFLVSDFAAAEVASALSRLVRMRLLDIPGASSRLSDFDAWRAVNSSPVDVHASDARLAYAFVRRFDLRLRAPDALHLAIAGRVNATMVTLDRVLATAAQQLGIPVDVPREPGRSRP
jgi:predicted nucleic acid-binding protein